MAGGMKVNSDKRADLVFMVNTNFDGTTGAANDLNNVYIPNENIIDLSIWSMKRYRQVKSGYWRHHIWQWL